jgi:hypothetical protein
MEQKLSGTILISESFGIENKNNFNTKHFKINQQKITPYEIWQLETYGNIIKEDETQHDVESELD